MKMKWLHLKAG